MFEVLKIQMHEKKSLFELNEKVLRSSFEIIFGVRTARVFELKKNLPYVQYSFLEAVKQLRFHFSVVYTYEVLPQRKSIWQPTKLYFV